MNKKIELIAKNCLESAFPIYDKNTCGYCAKVIREKVETGLNCVLDRVVSAKDYGPSYEKVGFKKIFEYPTEKIKDYKPQIGDICIINYTPNGHICMFTGKKWVSDFVQTDMYGGKIRLKDPKFIIYRYEK